MKRIKPCLYTCWSFLFLIIAASTCFCDDIPYTAKEMLGNGDFEGYDGTHYGIQWLTNCSITADAARNGNGGLDTYHFNTDQRESYFLQTLPFPSQLKSATLGFDYRVVRHDTTQVSPTINIQVYIARGENLDYSHMYRVPPPMTTIGVIHTENYTQPSEWRRFETAIDPAILSGMQSARDAGESVFLVFLMQSADQIWTDLVVHIDNVSLRMTGIQHVPAMRGMIAYYEADGEDSSTEEGAGERPWQNIKLLDPNTRNTNTIRTSQYLKPEIKWKPDGSQIAFVSDKEFLFSPYYADIFTIRPDGSQLQKVTSRPSQDEIINGDYPHVTLTGTVHNTAPSDSGLATLIICPLGAQDCAKVLVDPNEMAEFTIPDVAVLGNSDTFKQRASIYWSNSNCISGLELDYLMGIVQDGAVDLGTISFEGSLCMPFRASFRPNDLSWKRDGSKISAANVPELRLFDPDTGDPPAGEPLPYIGVGPEALEWSPVDNRYLYIAFNNSSDLIACVYLAGENGDSELLLEDVMRISPAWLADGSGFIYVKEYPEQFADLSYAYDRNANLFSYDLNSRSFRQLTYFYNETIKNISISPDSRHIIFTRCTDNSTCALWIMDRLNPAEMWQVTEAGDIDAPDWSRIDIEGSNLPGGSNAPDADGKGGSGGCFVNAVCNFGGE